MSNKSEICCNVVYSKDFVNAISLLVKKFCLIYILFISACYAVKPSFNFLNELSESELNNLNSAPLLKTEKSGKTWPDVILYQVVDASPLESVAIFYALDYQKEYIPNLKSSTVIKTVKPSLVHTRYVMDMPWPISDSVYVHASELFIEKPSSYKVKWWMVESDSTEKVEGYAIFIPYKNKTIMKYFAHVEPKSFLATFVKNKMLEDVKASLEATKKAIESIKKERKDILKKYVSFIDLALDGKKVY